MLVSSDRKDFVVETIVVKKWNAMDNLRTKNSRNPIHLDINSDVLEKMIAFSKKHITDIASADGDGLQDSYSDEKESLKSWHSLFFKR